MRPHRIVRLLAGVALLAPAAACYTWPLRDPSYLGTSPNPERVAEVTRRDGTVVRVANAEVRGDTLYGTIFHPRPRRGDTTSVAGRVPVAIPVSELRGLKVRMVEAVAIAGIVAGGIALIILIFGSPLNWGPGTY